MTQLKAFIKKEFYHIFRDKRTLLILFGIPIVQITLFGFAITNEINSAKIVIWDKSHDVMTENITNKILANHYFKIYRDIKSKEDLDLAFKEGKIKLAIIFDENFASSYQHDALAKVQLISDATDPNTANTLLSYVSAIISDYQNDLNRTLEIPYQIKIETRMIYNPHLKGVFMFVPGIMTVILMLVSAMMTSIAITREKELGTMEILLVSPLKTSTIIIGKVLPYLVLSFGVTTLILLLGKFIFGMPMNGNLFLLVAECMLYILTSLSLGIFISTKADSQQTAMMISFGAIMLPTLMLSGFIFPIANMPLPLQLISNIIPARWFNVICKNLMVKGSDFMTIWKETSILITMMTVLILLSIKNLKIRLE